MTATLPRMTEREFMDQVTQLAELRGWSWAHFRPAQTAKGWRTPVSGPLGKGWPDLVLVRERDHRLIFAELKLNASKMTDDQLRVLGILAEAMTGWQREDGSAPAEAWVWVPENWVHIEAALR